MDAGSCANEVNCKKALNEEVKVKDEEKDVNEENLEDFYPKYPSNDESIKTEGVIDDEVFTCSQSFHTPGQLFG